MFVTVVGLPDFRTYVLGPKAVNVPAQSGRTPRTISDKSPRQVLRERLRMGCTALQRNLVIGAERLPGSEIYFRRKWRNTKWSVFPCQAKKMKKSERAYSRRDQRRHSEKHCWRCLGRLWLQSWTVPHGTTASSQLAAWPKMDASPKKKRKALEQSKSGLKSTSATEAAT